MLTYAEIMTTNVGALTAAADNWQSMASEIKKVEDRYGVSDHGMASFDFSQRLSAMEQLTHAPAGSGKGHEAGKIPSSDPGAVTGAMNSIGSDGSDVILDERNGKVAAADDMARYAHHGIGAPITGLPVFGDTAQRLVHAATYEWSKDVISAASAAAREKDSDHYSAGLDGTYSLIDAWATDRGGHQRRAQREEGPERGRVAGHAA
ncbi:hypothetical protein RGF97_07655 [Streptomyces roseicoloratus]|uniref:WXG100 family type VII secretion target n=1 Tax=Streptomyces roseicoloratus TaxID=2508722 RepID=A0ABY9RRB8_9ACTN|nr:hypothetical protein [Streptomyces roseicoloratus]WMX44752.1 hypothetical protein RGF97_07655 [Streptomyces roseicoloratus]